MNTFKNNIYLVADLIIGARRTASGDIILYILIVEVRKELEVASE